MKPKAKAFGACIVKPHFDCDGTGQKCNRCGESEAACPCTSPDLVKCKGEDGCDGTGRLCVAHESPVGAYNGKCDAANAVEQARTP